MKKVICILLIAHSLHIVAKKPSQSRAIKVSQAIAEQKRNHVARAIASIQTIQRQHALQQQQHAQTILKKAIKEKKALKYKHEPIPFTKVELTVDAQGYPTIKALQKLMKMEYFPRKQIDDIIVAPVQGGFFTDKIYTVALNNNPQRKIFFLKISNHKDSAKRLAALQEENLGKYMIETRYAESKLPVRKKDLPIFAWVEKFYIYNNDKIIEVTHAARGTQVSDILSSKDNVRIIQLMKTLGKALGSLQQIFMNYNGEPNDPTKWTTICHGDLHGGNMIFNEKTSKLYFIDTETTRDKCAFWYDTRIIDYVTHAQTKEFWIAYIATFPQQQQEALKKDPNIKRYLV